MLITLSNVTLLFEINATIKLATKAANGSTNK